MGFTRLFFYFPRAVLKSLKAARDRKILEWEMALRVQAAWRGKTAKIIVSALRIVRVSVSFLPPPGPDSARKSELFGTPNTARTMLGALVLRWGCFPGVIYRPRGFHCRIGDWCRRGGYTPRKPPPNEARRLQSKKNKTPGGSHTGH